MTEDNALWLKTIIYLNTVNRGVKAKGFYLPHYSIALRTISLSHIDTSETIVTK